MRKLIYILSLWSIVALGCKRGEKVAEVAQEDIDFAIQSIEEITQASSNTLQDPGAPVVKRYTYNGYFLFVSDTGINLKNKCVTYDPQNPADSDGDKVYPNATINFNCNNLTDTVIKNNETYVVNYTLKGILNHLDNDTINPFVFSVSWGGQYQNLFEVIMKVYKGGNLIENKNYSQTGSIKMEKVNDNDSVYRLIRSINHMGNDLTCRSVSVNETIYVFLNEASGWKPGDTLGNRTLKTWPIGKGTLKTCSNIDVNLSFSPTDTDTLRIGKCPSGNVGITSGKLRIVLELPTGPKEIIKPFSCTQ